MYVRKQKIHIFRVRIYISKSKRCYNAVHSFFKNYFIGTKALILAKETKNGPQEKVSRLAILKIIITSEQSLAATCIVLHVD